MTTRMLEQSGKVSYSPRVFSRKERGFSVLVAGRGAPGSKTISVAYRVSTSCPGRQLTHFAAHSTVRSQSPMSVSKIQDRPALERRTATATIYPGHQALYSEALNTMVILRKSGAEGARRQIRVRAETRPGATQNHSRVFPRSGKTEKF